MILIAKYRGWIIAICIVSAVLLLWTSVIGPRTGMISLDEISQLGLTVLVLPAFIFCLSFMPLMYHSWFYKKKNVATYYFRMIFFWLVTLSMALFWVFFTWNFILQKAT